MIRNRSEGTQRDCKRFLLAARVATIVVAVVASVFVSSWLQAQSGGKIAFDSASVKPSSSPRRANIGLNNLDDLPPDAGLFSANAPLNAYLSFAYKLTPDQVRLLEPQLPKWATTGLFEIEARAQGGPTKDQIRLMLQTLLANRFKLKVHVEPKQLPLFDLVTVEANHPGPRLRPHSQALSCDPVDSSRSVNSTRVPNTDASLTNTCGSLMESYESGRFRMRARNVPMALIAGYLSGSAEAHLERPVIDKTGFDGRFDFNLEFIPNLPATGPFQPNPQAATFPDALKYQLGLQLVPRVGTVDVLVIDHVEEPSRD